MTDKPIKRKSYGSIPHLPGSRTGPTDSTCHEGQARICTEKTRDKHDRVIVQEKLDGANVGIVRLDNRVIALTRSGILAENSKFELHHEFSNWVGRRQDLFMSILEEGERLCGEWLWQAHGTIYNLSDEFQLFAAFDLMREAKRASYEEFTSRIGSDVSMAPLLSDGVPCSISNALELLGTFGKYSASDPAEGCVWRVERRGVFDFIAKYVHHNKVDGQYLDSNPPIINLM